MHLRKPYESRPDPECEAGKGTDWQAAMYTSDEMGMTTVIYKVIPVVSET